MKKPKNKKIKIELCALNSDTLYLCYLMYLLADCQYQQSITKNRLVGNFYSYILFPRIIFARFCPSRPKTSFYKISIFFKFYYYQVQYLLCAVVSEGLQHAKGLEEDGTNIDGGELVVPGGEGQLQGLPQLQREGLVHGYQLVNVQEHCLNLNLAQQTSNWKKMCEQCLGFS